MIKKIKETKEKEALSSLKDEASNIININGKKVLFKITELDDINIAKAMSDMLIDTYHDILVFIINQKTDKIFFVAKTSPEYVKEGIHCGKIVKEVAILCGGNGGGRPDMAQAGGKNKVEVQDIIEKVKEILS